MHEKQRLYRCAADIRFDDKAPSKGVVLDVKLKDFSETCNCLQLQRPLTRRHPSFSVHVVSLVANSQVTIGIAGPDIEDDIPPGQWNGTVGYSSSGQCYSSHKSQANTTGQKFTEGDWLGVEVTYFGKDMSTVLFLKNGLPIATRYLFETDHNCFLPTIALTNGPIVLGVIWPQAVVTAQSYSEMNLQHWIKSDAVSYDREKGIFSLDDRNVPQSLVQSPRPFSKDIHHYEVVAHEVSATGAAATIGIATCSAMNPPPTCRLLNNFFHWHPDGSKVKMKAGQRMGFGIQYSPEVRESPDFEDRQEQLVLCYVTVDSEIVFAHMMLQPPGGWYPSVALHPYASKVQIDMDTSLSAAVNGQLDREFLSLLPDSQAILREDMLARSLDVEQFRKSEALEVEFGLVYTTVTLPRLTDGIHVIQFCCPLTPDDRYYAIEIKMMGDSSMVCMGIADSSFPLTRYPGRMMDTLGYYSRDGRMYYNNKDKGNTTGRRYGKGDVVGVEVEVFEVNMSVALFSKNGSPVGTRFITQTDHSQFLPTLAICGNGAEVVIDVVWQNRVSEPPVFNVTNVEQWCLPEESTVDVGNNIVYVEPSHTEVETIQAPYSLHRTYNHFEVELIDDFCETLPPPAIVLCTASPFDPTPKSNFKQDFIRFWATGEALKAVKKGDLMGWGLLYPDESKHHDAEQLVICYLTINRNVNLTRVMYQPPGGFYPVILLPPGVHRVKLNFDATIITDHPFTPEMVQKLLATATEMIAEEDLQISKGAEPEDWDCAENKGKYLRPLPMTEKVVRRFREKLNPSTVGETPGLRRRTHKMANLVELMVKGKLETKVKERRDSEETASSVCTIA